MYCNVCYKTLIIGSISINDYAHDCIQVDTSIVVFDLTDGQSSSHSGRVFQENVNYSIYIKIDSAYDSANRISIVDALGNNNKWTGGANLGEGDKIILVGTGSPISGPNGNARDLPTTSNTWASGAYAWKTEVSSQTLLYISNPLQKVETNRGASGWHNTQIWTGQWVPILSINIGTALPTGVATSQGV